jgi:hypothetical protein
MSKHVQQAELRSLFEETVVETRRGAKVIRCVPKMFPAVPVSGVGEPQPMPGVLMFLEHLDSALIEHRKYMFFRCGQPVPEEAEAIDTIVFQEVAFNLYWIVGAVIPPAIIEQFDRQRLERERAMKLAADKMKNGHAPAPTGTRMDYLEH